MTMEFVFVFSSELQVHTFLRNEKIPSYLFHPRKKMLRCHCTRQQAEAALDQYHAALLDVKQAAPEFSKTRHPLRLDKQITSCRTTLNFSFS